MKPGYSFKKVRETLNHLLFMYDLNLYSSSSSGIDSFVRLVKVVSGVVGMNFGMDKCAVLKTKRGK